MHRFTPPIFAISIVLAAGGAWLLGKSATEPRPSSAPSPVTVEPGKDDQALRREVALLRREVAELGQRPRPEEAKAAEPDPARQEASKAAEAAPPATEEERRQAVKQAHEKWKKGMETMVRKGPLDARWTSQMQQEVAAAFTNGAGTAVRSVECHASLCQVELAHDDRQALEHVKGDLSSTLHYPVTLLHEPDGSSFKSVLFIARAGEAMPDWRREAAEAEEQL